MMTTHDLVPIKHWVRWDLQLLQVIDVVHRLDDVWTVVLTDADGMFETTVDLDDQHADQAVWELA